ncbi:hypothetical protein CJ177_40300 [Rhodococcus sp. ACPA1]|nr:hypothetical protein CJ177_40300 [Rhodococcus sp. ACPA1]
MVVLRFVLGDVGEYVSQLKTALVPFVEWLHVLACEGVGEAVESPYELRAHGRWFDTGSPCAAPPVEWIDGSLRA